MVQLIHELIYDAARRDPARTALSVQGIGTSYAGLAEQVEAAAQGLLLLGLQRRERVAVYLEKREETVVAMFGAAAAGGVFVPVNPLLKPAQVAYILADSGARVLVTTADRLATLGDALARCPDLRTVVVAGAADDDAPVAAAPLEVAAWNDCMRAPRVRAVHRAIESDMVALLYTSGSTGRPKGVVLSHHNMVTGALSVAGYLGNTPHDRILSVLPLSFDYGLSQLTTAFASGACAVLMNYLLARDVIETVEREAITGLAAVPPLWIALSQMRWPRTTTLRYLTNSGGAMPCAALDALRRALPQTRVYLMYGLTEAFRSTFLPPEQIDRRPGSIGKAIPNAEVLVLRPDGTPCAPNEPGELVHRGPLVALGYWNDAARTAERFRPLSLAPQLPIAETAVWSGDTVRIDDEGYLYFIGRTDEMIKTSGYRVSPTEVEEVLHASGMVADVVALGLPHPSLGQAIAVLATAKAGAALDGTALLAACRASLPGYMQPAWVEVREGALPRNPNGKIDRRLLADELARLFSDAQS